MDNKKFNETPFSKNTPVIPFSNSSEADYWLSNNCERCINYDNEDNENNTKCNLCYHIDMGFFEGTIPLWVAKNIGCKYEPLYGYCDLHSRCSNFRTGDEPF